MTLKKAVRIPLLVVLLAANAIGLQGWTGTHRARLSADLLAHEAHRTSKRVRVIVHGTADEVQTIAARHNLTIVRQLEQSAVLAVNSAELSNLATDPAVDHVSPDARVRLMMSVSNVSSGASQVRAGTGGLRGLIAAFAPVTGQRSGVA